MCASLLPFPLCASMSIRRGQDLDIHASDIMLVFIFESVCLRLFDVFMPMLVFAHYQHMISAGTLIVDHKE